MVPTAEDIVPIPINKIPNPPITPPIASKADNNFTELLDHRVLHKHDHDDTDKQDHRSVLGHIQRQKLSCHRCTDIGTEDHTDCLRQIHQTRIYKADDHNSGRIG